MIEVEKKFIFSSEQEKSLVQEGNFVSQKSIVDQYYDNEEYFLTKENYWLRKRDNTFELKIPTHSKIYRNFDSFRELTDEKLIRKVLGFSHKGISLEQELINQKYFAYFDATTHRKSYRIGDFNSARTPRL